MLVIFGGRPQDRSQALNDIWGLRKHRDGSWDWTKAPPNSQGDQPVGRFQHSSYFIGSLMIVTGGRNAVLGQEMPLQIFDSDSSSWCSLKGTQLFRHISFMFNDKVLTHGGLENRSDNQSISNFFELNLSAILSNKPYLKDRLQAFVRQFVSPHPSRQNSPLSTPKMQSRRLQNLNLNRNNDVHRSELGNGPRTMPSQNRLQLPD